MKIVTLLFIFSFQFNYSLAQKYPNGVVKYGEISLLMDKDFIANKDWSEYIYYQKNVSGTNSDNFSKSLPDSIIWQKEYEGSKMPGVLGIDTKYANNPIIGLSFIQIKEYCTWREERLKEKYNRNYICRLPNIDEVPIFFKRKKDDLSYNILVMIDNEPKIGSYNTSTNTFDIIDYENDMKFFFFCVMEVSKQPLTSK